MAFAPCVVGDFKSSKGPFPRLRSSSRHYLSPPA
jgi:hypothetical protein